MKTADCCCHKQAVTRFPWQHASKHVFVSWCWQSSVQQQQLVDRLQSFIGNTARASFIIFIPAVLLTAAYRQYTHVRMYARTHGRTHILTGGFFCPQDSGGPIREHRLTGSWPNQRRRTALCRGSNKDGRVVSVSGSDTQGTENVSLTLKSFQNLKKKIKLLLCIHDFSKVKN